MVALSMKPLDRKAYGHIPHLPGSRMGPGDHHCHAGQAAICTTKARDKHDLISVTVKLDGSCCSVANIDGVITPLTRSGYRAETSKYEQHHLFAQWVWARQHLFLAGLAAGQRFVGEWLAMAHGTRYNLHHEPFVVFDMMTGDHRHLTGDCHWQAARCELPTPAVLHVGGPFGLADAIAAIETPRHGEIDPVEGAVWRVERNGKFDFIAKWVRPDKVDGKYFAEPVWNWRPEMMP